MQYRYGKGDYLDFELRISIYEGRYLGDYMPYVVSDTTDLSAAITAAQSTADGKNTVYYQASAPTGGTYKVNDIWFDTNDGNKMYMWNGSAWTAETFGSAAISDLSITNAKIANATIQSAKIASLDAGKIEEQRQTLTTIMARGFLEPVLFMQESNDLAAEADALTAEKDQLVKEVTGCMKMTEALNDLTRYAGHAQPSPDFDGELVERFLDYGTVQSREEITFHLKCGLSLTERMGET